MTRIHCTARFDGQLLNHHECFLVGFPESEIPKAVNNIVNLAIEKIKIKCKQYFKIDFETMNSFEVYYYDKQGEEIQIFKKEKTE
jgi:transcriptional regulator of nitric oxide reductase